MEHRLVLGDMPVYIKQKIVDETDIVSQMSLRLCSREFRNLVSYARIHYEEIEIGISYACVRIRGRCSSDFNRSLLLYGSRGCDITHFDLIGPKASRRYIPGLNYADEAVARLTRIFENPRTSTERLKVELRNPTNKERLLSGLGEAVRARRGRLNVKELSVEIADNPQDVLSVIALVKPGKLRSIKIINHGQHSDEEALLFLAEIAETEQWKRAKELRLQGFSLDIPHEKWAHLQMDGIRIGTLTLECMHKMLKSFARHPKWRETEIAYQSDNHEQIKEYFEYVSNERVAGNRWKINVNGAASDLVLASLRNSQITLWKEAKGLDDLLSTHHFPSLFHVSTIFLSL